MSNRENTVALFLFEDEARLDALLRETRSLLGERLLSAAVAAFTPFGQRFDRHVRLQSHALFPQPRQRRAWAAYCATSQKLLAAVAAASLAASDRLAFAKSLDRVDALFGRYVRQEQRILAPVMSRSSRAFTERI